MFRSDQANAYRTVHAHVLPVLVYPRLHVVLIFIVVQQYSDPILVGTQYVNQSNGLLSYPTVPAAGIQAPSEL